MTKAQLVTHLAEKFDLPKKTAGAILEESSTLAAAQTKKLGGFAIPGVGKLVKQQRKACKGRNPATGQEIKVPAKTVAKMRLLKVCKDAVAPPKR